ncbi:MAG: HAD-IA family hydrolase [Oscillospiraceae bacterium]|nr:HAD-IA family hydrolase [Oscillospiraceae bacterium]
MIKYIIFDMDGVLVDSEAAIRAACIEMFARRGLAVNGEDFIPFTGMGENRFISGVAEKYGMDFSLDMKAEAYAIYAEIAHEHVIVFEGITELIEQLRGRGLKLAVASAADDVKVRVNLSCIGLGYDDFDAVITGSDVTKHKPDPQCFLMACEKLGGIPAQSLVVEDAVAGCKAAKAAGMACIGVTSTFGADELLAAGADCTVDKTPGIAAKLFGESSCI